MTRYKRTNVRTTGQKKRKNPVDNQPARYSKKPECKKPGTKKKDGTRGHKTRVKTTGLKRTGSYYWHGCAVLHISCCYEDMMIAFQKLQNI